ncbi:MAG: hypothetical protein MUP15_03275 [Dehalococcoidia bacterium]|nr:hypothetical protein [Dehalococcoidia bacterium]
MRTPGKARFIGALAAMLVIATTLTLGCGGGGDKIDFSSGGGDKDNGTASASNDSEGSGTSKQAKGADEYASQFCGALNKYADDIQGLTTAETDMEDPAAMQDFIDQMVPLFEGISKDLDKINPPSEAADWHNGLVEGMSAAADLFSQMGDALDKPLDEAMAEITDLSTEMSDLDNPFGSMGDLPEEYQTAFENNADCQDLQNLDIFQ